MKKSTNWITIPDEALHTPASKAKGKKKQGKKSESVTNKLLWGVGFVVMAVVVFAVLAPNQFNDLLKGSLFDAEGVDSPISSPSDLLAPVDGGEGEGEEVDGAEGEGEEVDGAEGEGEEVDGAEGEEVYVSDPVVQPEEDAVSISIDPIVEPGGGVVDCGEDLDCFLPHLEDCSLAKMTYKFDLLGQSLEADQEITGSEAEDCLIKVLYTKIPIPQMVQKDAVCKIEKGTYDEDRFTELYEDMDDLLESCSGPAIDAFKVYMESVTADQEDEVQDSQAKLIEDLSKQLEQIQKQREEDIKTMQELADATKPSAQEGVPPSITTTTTIGQPPAVQPGFRVNTHTATITPQEMLSRNMAGGYQVAQQSTTQPVYQPAYQVSTPPAVQTPDTGPSEVMFIAFLLTFVGLLGWKLIRLSIA